MSNGPTTDFEQQISDAMYSARGTAAAQGVFILALVQTLSRRHPDLIPDLLQEMRPLLDAAAKELHSEEELPFQAAADSFREQLEAWQNAQP